MSYTIIGSCKKCGAPIYHPSIWHGVTPPPPYYSCNCYSKANYVYTTNTTTQQPVVGPNAKEAVEKLWEEFEDNDIVVDTKPTNESLLRRLRKLEKLVEELTEKLENSNKDKERLETIRKILKG